jgi:chemotaxis protein methyltransferase CheR
MSIKLGDFDLFRDLLYKESGLVVTPDKTYLLESRLLPVAKKWNFASLEAVAVALRALPDRKLIDDIVDAMTTNETSFFRDQKPFQMFEQVVFPAVMASNRVKTSKKIRIWSAAASTGQESYTLSMLLKEK